MSRFEKPVPRPAGNEPKSWTEIRAITFGFDQAVRDSEAKWGVGRLLLLVSTETLLAFNRGFTLWNQAITGGDVAAMRTLAPQMVAGLAYMDAEATAAGKAPLAPNVWEVRLATGTAVAFVRTQAEAAAVAVDGRQMEVWTLEEVARLLPRMVSDIKLAFPGATVTRVTTHDEGAATEWLGGYDEVGQMVDGVDADGRPE